MVVDLDSSVLDRDPAAAAVLRAPTSNDAGLNKPGLVVLPYHTIHHGSRQCCSPLCQNSNISGPTSWWWRWYALVSNFKAIPAENPSCARIDERAKFGQHRKSVFVLYSQFKILTFACPGQLGIERDRINIFFKSPARANVFLQTRNVDIHSSRGTWLIWMCCIYLFNLPF